MAWFSQSLRPIRTAPLGLPFRAQTTMLRVKPRMSLGEGQLRVGYTRQEVALLHFPRVAKLFLATRVSRSDRERSYQRLWRMRQL